MTRIDRVFKELEKLYELNRAIQGSVWSATGQPVRRDYPVKESSGGAMACEPDQGTSSDSCGGNPTKP
jgi:hypothetical protein